ncbi:hypothetical protein LAZ67_8003870 [Cordylochernes scorpioides]|uniref:DUF7153 domain-containing protein n=1 Tax=Cordylochernes scorpioides TaxID=51811 RepID=A0ABY6KSM9_9ARAC|nr:hypothetical protein LAZ67_8003870 [Cordylochernes scorpioides]
MDACKNMVEMTRTDPEWMQKIITGDETWVYQYDPETKRQSSQWIERGEPKPKKARFTKSKVKTLLVTFFYINGLVHHEFIPFGRTINQEVYLRIMRRLREAVRLKRPERWQNNDWILHVDNARPHTAHVVLKFLAKHSTIQIPHPPYSPDLAPNDFFLYPKLKMKLKGRKFDNVDMIQAESKATLRNLSKSDFISCFDNWKKRWNRQERSQPDLCHRDISPRVAMDLETVPRTVFTYITPGDVLRTPYTVHKPALVRALARHRGFDRGLLLDTLEKGDSRPKRTQKVDNPTSRDIVGVDQVSCHYGDPVGVMFPVIHSVEVTTNSFDFLKPDDLGEQFRVQQGVYTEIRHYQPSPGLEPPNSDMKAYIFMGFKSLDSTFSEVLEDSWKDWTGARLVYLNLPHELGLSRLVFYRRTAPRNLDLFMYVVLAECTNVGPANRARLLDFVQRLRVDRVFGYLSVYRNVAAITPCSSSTTSTQDGQQVDV